MSADVHGRGVAAVCRRGHVFTAYSNPTIETWRRCGTCGAKILTHCPSCQAEMLGGWLHEEPTIFDVTSPVFDPDAFCWKCGGPYPWASRAEIVLHIENQLEEQADLAEGDRRDLLLEPSFDPPYPVINAANELRLFMGPPEPRTPHTPDEWIKHFSTLPLMYQPGERWQYNAGSLVLGVLVARASGLTLADFFRTRIFDPLGMKETGFFMPVEDIRRLPGHYMTDPETGKPELQNLSAPSEWTKPPVFPSGAAGLLSTVDDYLAFARLLLNKGAYEGGRLLSEESVTLMTTNHLTPDQIADGGLILGGRGWGFGMAVVTAPDDVSAVPGRYCWEGGYGSGWFNDPDRNLVAIAMTQTSDFLFNGGLAEFERLAAQA